MDNLFSIFLVQAALCTVLFVLIYYFIKKNNTLKKEINTLKDNFQDEQKEIGDR